MIQLKWMDFLISAAQPFTSAGQIKENRCHWAVLTFLFLKLHPRSYLALFEVFRPQNINLINSFVEINHYTVGEGGGNNDTLSEYRYYKNSINDI